MRDYDWRFRVGFVAKPVGDSPSVYQEWQREEQRILIFRDEHNLHGYRDNCKAKAIKYRDEMVNRLGPSAIGDARDAVDYETPTVWLALQEIARDLTRLAGALFKDPRG